MAETARALGLSISEYAVLVHEIVGPALLRAGLTRAQPKTSLLTASLMIGAQVSLLAPLKPGPAECVAIIPGNVTPSAHDILRWYGPDAKSGAFRATVRARYVFERIGEQGAYVVVPENWLGRAVEIDPEKGGGR